MALNSRPGWVLSSALKRKKQNQKKKTNSHTFTSCHLKGIKEWLVTETDMNFTAKSWPFKVHRK